MTIKNRILLTSKTITMSLYTILFDDWSDYDSKKNSNGEDAKYFAASEDWEVEYLAKKIKKHHPSMESKTIKQVIVQYCLLSGSPYPRTKFLAGLAQKLHIHRI